MTALPGRRFAPWATLLCLAAAAAPARAQPAPEAPPADPSVKALTDRLEAMIVEERARTAQVEARLEAVAAQSDELRAQRDKAAAQEKLTEAKRPEVTLQSLLGSSMPGEDKVRFYGFMDMGFQYMHFSDGGIASGAIQSQAPTFVMGNINLYVDAQPFERWRALFEVRFTNYPDGSSQLPALGQPYSRTSTTVYDVTSPSGGWSQIQYGSIVLERAFIQGTVARWLNVRLGYWPTPYGIWNVDHGTPTRISLNEPQFVVADAFPSKQTGLDLTGTVALAAWELEYHAYVSNGRTPGQLSLTNGKALGGRLVLRRTLPFPVALGASGYYGRYVDIQTKLAQGTLNVVQDTVVAYDEVGGAADLTVDLKPVRIRSEFVVNQRRYDDGAHSPAPLGLGDLPSQTFWGTYGLLAYRLPWGGVEPYVFAELDRNLVPSAQGAGSVSGGINVYLTPGVQVKLQYTHLQLFDFDRIQRPLGQSAIDFAASRLVLAF
jgi:hypothetical protein